MTTAAILSALYNSPMDAVSWSLRSLIAARPGHRFLTADYSNIEGRALAWLAGEAWKLEAFRDYDTIIGHDPVKDEPIRKGPDLYRVAYARSFGIPVEEVTKDQRQTGKVQELALGYQGGHGAFLSMAKNYSVVPWLRRDGPAPKGISLPAIAEATRAAVASSVWDDAQFLYWQGAREAAAEVAAERRIQAKIAEETEPSDDPDEYSQPTFDEIAIAAKKNRHGLSPEIWTALRIVVDGWRQAHTATTIFWRQLEDAATAAIERPGEVVRAGEHIRYCRSGDFLYCRLPSGRCLGYPYPRIVRRLNKTTNRETRKIEFEGVDSKTKKWMVQTVYGGLLAENVTQAVSRDVLADAMLRLEAHGYRVVMHVHDEIVCEMPDGQGSLNEMCSLMSTVEPWARGLPVSVAGWEGRRYRK